MNILIIEDDPGVISFIEKGLKENDFIVKCASDGKTGLDLALKEVFDIIILDVMIPSLNGIEVCDRIRFHNKYVSILMLTALDSTEDKIIGLNSGADDYLTKPFDFFELLARLKALSRRSKKEQDSSTIFTIADLVLNDSSKRVFRNNKEIILTAKEYALLHFFLKNKENILSRAHLASCVWDNSFDSGTNVVDVYVNYLRNKIDKGFENKLIHTVFGMGYILKEN